MPIEECQTLRKYADILCPLPIQHQIGLRFVRQTTKSSCLYLHDFQDLVIARLRLLAYFTTNVRILLSFQSVAITLPSMDISEHPPLRLCLIVYTYNYGSKQYVLFKFIKCLQLALNYRTSKQSIKNHKI